MTPKPMSADTTCDHCGKTRAEHSGTIPNCMIYPTFKDTLTSKVERLEVKNRMLVEALENIEGRVDYAIGMYHDATRWASEGDPDGEGTLRDYVFAEARSALERTPE